MARIYVRYAHFPDDPHRRAVVQSRYDTSKPSVVRVRAVSAKQATFLAASRIKAVNGGTGIVSIR